METPRIYGLDLAKGLALAGIAIANVLTSFSLYWNQSIPDPQHITGSVDQGLYLFFTSVIDGKFFPLYATLFGFGLGVLVKRGMSYLRVRLSILAVIGAVHMSLLYYGDIVLIYALSALLLTLIPWSNRSLTIVASITLVLYGVIQFSPSAPDFMPLGALSDRLEFQALMTVGTLVALPLQAIKVLPFMALGLMMYKRHLLTNPPTLRLLAPALMALFALGFVSGVQELSGQQHPVVYGLSHTLGSLAGPLLVLVAAHFKPHRRLDPIAVLGRSSLSGYILQSLYFWMVAYLWMDLELEVHDMVQAALWAWIVSICIINTFNALGHQGPAERLLRYLSSRFSIKEFKA